MGSLTTSEPLTTGQRETLDDALNTLEASIRTLRAANTPGADRTVLTVGTGLMIAEALVLIGRAIDRMVLMSVPERDT